MSVESLFAFDENLLYLNFISVAIAYYFSFKRNKLNSTLLSLGIMMVFSFLMTSYTQPLYDASVKYQADYLHEFRFLWFLGFSFWDLSIVGLLLLSHNKFRLKRSFCANAVILAYSVKMGLHITLYIEKELFLSNYFEPIYKSGIPGINMLFAATVFGFVLTVLGSIVYTRITKKKGLSWCI